MQGQTTYPVIMPIENCQLLSSLCYKQLNEFISAGCEEEGLEIVRNPIATLLAQLFQGINFSFRSKFVFEELWVHKFRAGFSFYQEQCFYYIFVCKKAVDRCFLIDIPYNHRLIIGGADDKLVVDGDSESADPSLMPCESTFTESGIDFPEFDCFIAWTRKDVFAFLDESYVWDVVVVPIKCFTALVVVAKVPEFDGEIRGGGNKVFAMGIVVDAVDGIWIIEMSTCVSFQGPFEIAGLEFPDFDGSVFGGGGELGVGGMEGQTGDGAFVSFEFEFGGSFEQVQIFLYSIFIRFGRSGSNFFLKVFVFFF